MSTSTFAFKIRDASGWTMFIFGALALLLGLIGLLNPETTLSLLGFPLLERAARATGDFTVTFLVASSMASFNMGVYYLLAVFSDFKPFYRWTVPFRGLTFTVFTIVSLTGIAPLGFLGVGIWELAGAIATGLALYAESRKNR
jgi:hypothetical protein